jgi:Protein similar to CwfJ C-terminus 2
LYYRSALTEQMEEYGTNPKLIHTNNMKPLHQSIPKNFPYFYVEFDNSTRNNNGYVLMIESSTKFPSTFGIDTIASMMEIEPIRFRNKLQQKMSEVEERRIITNFVQQHDKLLH